MKKLFDRFTIREIVQIYILGSKFSSYFRKHISTYTPRIIVTLFSAARATSSESIYSNLYYFEERDSVVAKKTLCDIERKIVDDFFITNHEKNSPKKIESLSELIQQLNVNKLLRLSFNLFARGYIIASGYVREVARQKTLKNQDCNLSSQRKEGAMIEELYFQKPIISDSENNNAWSRQIENITYSNEVKDKRLNKFYCGYFEKLIQGKSLAIVGPNIDRDQSLFDELSNYDVVIFNNLISADDFIVRLSKSCTLVSYYNEFQAKCLYISNKHDVFDYVDYSVFRSFRFQYQISLLNENKAKLCFINKAVFNGVMQGFQAVLHDINRYQPLSIYATGYDLYTKSKTYSSGYLNASDSMLYDLARHDVIGNFRYLAAQYKYGVFQSDDSLKTVLQMSELDYLKRIEDVNSHW